MISEYKNFAGVETKFDICINRRRLHWFIVVKMKSSTSSVLSLEITTSNLVDLVPTIRLFQPSMEAVEKSTFVGDYHGSLQDLCETADDIVTEMGKYSLLSNNCQHFCNNLLKRLRLPTFDTTIGPTTTVNDLKEEFHTSLFTYLVGRLYDKTVSGALKVGVETISAGVIGGVVGAPTAHRMRQSSQDK